MAAQSKLGERFRKWLDGASGHLKSGNPFGRKADDIKLGTRLNELAEMTVGTATITNGNTSVTVSLGTDYASGKAVVSFAEDPGSATAVWASAASATGDLVITVDADPGADTDINYWVDAR